jgi:hypothetical protein
LNQFHFNCPRASAVGSRRDDLANPESTEMKELRVRPIFHFGICPPSYFIKTTRITVMQIALNVQLRISISHHSTNHVVKKLWTFWDFDISCHENLEAGASN